MELLVVEEPPFEVEEVEEDVDPPVELFPVLPEVEEVELLLVEFGQQQRLLPCAPVQPAIHSEQVP